MEPRRGQRRTARAAAPEEEDVRPIEEEEDDEEEGNEEEGNDPPQEAGEVPPSSEEDIEGASIDQRKARGQAPLTLLGRMAIHPRGTFDYRAIVPDRIVDAEFQCVMGRRLPPEAGTDPEECLAGSAPILRVTNAGLTPDAGPRRPWVMRSRFTLIPTGIRAADPHAGISCCIDRALTERMRPGDTIYFARTMCGGVGLSVVRDDQLVVAAGAVTAVPLGRDVMARIPGDLIQRAGAILRERDPEFGFHELPLEMAADGATSILANGQRTLGRYIAVVVHGFLPGLPGTDECAAIWREGACAEVAANASAMLLDGAIDVCLYRG